jgi:hypothetical protein
VRWWHALRPDPLRRLRLGAAEGELRRLSRSSLPAPTPSQQARVEIAVRAVTAAAAQALPPRWGDAIRTSSTAPGADLSDALDGAVMSVDLTHRTPTWWSARGAAADQLAAAAVVGLGWVATLWALAVPRIYPHTPTLGPVPLPSVLLVGGLAGGLGLALACRGFVGAGARRRRNKVAALLRQAVSGVAYAHVVSPVAEVLADHRAARQALESA